MDLTLDRMLPGLEQDALSEHGNIRARASAASLLLKLSGIDPVAVPAMKCDDLPKACSRIRPQYKVLREWARRGYVTPPILWKGGRARWVERSCVEAVILCKLLKRGLRGDELASVMRRALGMSVDALVAIAREPDGMDSLIVVEV